MLLKPRKASSFHVWVKFLASHRLTIWGVEDNREFGCRVTIERSDFAVVAKKEVYENHRVRDLAGDGSFRVFVVSSQQQRELLSEATSSVD